jgi:hypothetical protein
VTLADQLQSHDHHLCFPGLGATRERSVLENPAVIVTGLLVAAFLFMPR